MTPQKVFADNVHFWIWPVLLVGVKIIFDLLPRIVFVALMAAAVGAFFLFNKNQEKKRQASPKIVQESPRRQTNRKQRPKSRGRRHDD